MRKRRIGWEPKAHPQRVDYHSNENDFLCVLLASIGLATDAIAERTGLTVGQVMYRILKADVRRGGVTSRMAYRRGRGDVVESVIGVVSANNNAVRRTVNQTLDSKGLYTPQPTGVMKHDRKMKLAAA